MLQPQSDEDIRPVVEEIKRLDPLVDVRWNPRARITKPGSYTILGKRTDPEYLGLWEVIRYNSPGLTDRGYVRLCFVTKPVRFGRREILMMETDGPYAPIGSWLIEYMRTWDSAQRQFAKVMEEVDVENERFQEGELAALIDGGGAHQEACERVYHRVAGPYWMGGAQGKAHPITVERMFGKGKRTCQA